MIPFFLLGLIISFPLTNIVVNKKLLSKKKQKLKTLINKIFFVHGKELSAQLLISFSIGIFFAVTSLLIINSDNSLLPKVLIINTILFTLIFLIYLSIYDIKFYEVDEIPSLILIVFLVILNLILALFNNELTLWVNKEFNAMNNLIAGIGAWVFIFLIVVLTKGKGMGGGDIRIAGIMGLILGIPGVIYAFYLAIFSAAFFGIAFGLSLGKIHGLKIPFLPFMIVATIIVFFLEGFVDINLFPSLY